MKKLTWLTVILNNGKFNMTNDDIKIIITIYDSSLVIFYIFLFLKLKTLGSPYGYSDDIKNNILISHLTVKIILTKH